MPKMRKPDWSGLVRPGRIPTKEDEKLERHIDICLARIDVSRALEGLSCQEIEEVLSSLPSPYM